MSAKSIATFAGGRYALAKEINVSKRTIDNWCRSKSSGGCGDVVPEKYRALILECFPALDYSIFQPVFEDCHESDI